MRSNNAATRVLRDPWLAFFALVTGAWAWLFAMAALGLGHEPAAALGPGMGWSEPVLSQLSRWLGAHPHHLGSAHTSLPMLMLMWSLMSIAMMAPTAVPMLAAYRHLADGNPRELAVTGFWTLCAGYLAVWVVFSMLMAIAQHGFAAAGLLTDLGVSTSLALSATLLAAAGLYQFSSVKHACLSRCRSPMAYFLANWKDGSRGAWQMGLHHGAICVGCCWALMALAFVGGTMNLAWMGLAMVFMVVEKLAIGRWLTLPMGAALLIAALIAAARASGLA